MEYNPNDEPIKVSTGSGKLHIEVIDLLMTWRKHLWSGWALAIIAGGILHWFVIADAAKWLFLTIWPLPEKGTMTDIAVHHNVGTTFGCIVTITLVICLGKSICLLFLADIQMQTRTKLVELLEDQPEFWQYLKQRDPRRAKRVTRLLGNEVEWLRPA